MGENAVTVVVEHDEESSLFRATSTGEYRGTKRRIEAVFEIEGGGPELVS